MTLVAKGPSVVRVVVRAVVWAAPLRKLQGRPREQDRRERRLLPLLKGLGAPCVTVLNIHQGSTKTTRSSTQFQDIVKHNCSSIHPFASICRDVDPFAIHPCGREA